MQKIRKHPTYRNATHTQSVLTITSNVVYGKAHRQHAGRPPQGRAVRAGRQPDARPRQPWLARLLPVGREAALQGCAGRHQLHRLGRAAKGAPVREELIDGAVKAFDMYFGQGGFHMNLNVIDKETLEDAMKNPDKYPQLTIRVSGYAVNFVRLTPEQQRT
jgi:formate C-acetyltransferase